MKDLFPHYKIGHFINQPASDTEFEITLFDEMEEPEVDDIHKHTFYEILWIEKGISTQIIDYKEYEIAPKTLFFISPNQVHKFEGWQDVSGGTIMFTENFFLFNYGHKNKLFELNFLDCMYARPYVQLNDADFADITRTIGLISEEHNRADKRVSITQALLHVLLEQIQRCVDQNTGMQVPKKSLVIYKKFKNLLEQHFNEQKNVSFYATELHLTQHHLNFVIRNLTGKTTTELIRNRAILEAKRLLTYTDYTISEVAAQLNYLDSSYFSRIFKAEAHCTPAAFKSEMSEKYRIR